MVGYHGTDRFRAGMALGPYELVTPIGSGGMATVWAARVRGTGQLVALKLLLPELAENLAFQQMFFDEARIASRVRHPNVCATYELASYDGVLMLVMEWVDGASLVKVLRPGYQRDSDGAPRFPIPYRLAAYILAEAAAGLHAAHETVGEDGRPLAVVHRDVSPHNILSTADGRIKVTDFGVAKALGKQHMTIAGQVKGKLAYMSPEQLVGGSVVDRRSDVFGLGCVLYEVTTGKRPFTGEHDPQVMAAIMMGVFERPSAVDPSYPKELEAIVLRALANDPKERFATAHELATALSTYVRASGPPLGPHDVAALLRERCGAEIAERARAVDDGRAPPPPRSVPIATGSSGAMEVDPQDGYSTVGLIVSALIGAALGIAVLAYVRSTREVEPPPPASIVAMPAPPPVVSESPSEAPAPRVVRFRVVPESATIMVDGISTSASAPVPRPPDGETTTVVVRAEGYRETIVLVDDATSDEVEVTLVPVPKTRPKPPFVPASAKVEEPQAPPNPYD